MNIGFKEEDFNVRNHKLKRSGNRLLTGFLLVFIFGYCFFFSSKIWMPAPYEGVEVMPIGESKVTENRTITLENWTYAKEDRKMEIILSIDNMSTDGIERYNWEIRTPSKKLHILKVLETDKLVVLQVHRVPKRWTELALLMTLKDQDRNKVKDFEGLKIYTNDKTVENVSNIRVRSPKFYEREVLILSLQHYKDNLKKKQNELNDLLIEKENIINKISELKNNMNYQTEREQADTSEKINSFLNDKNNVNTNINNIKEEINELNAKIVLKNSLLEK